jgi:hypothetical protein
VSSPLISSWLERSAADEASHADVISKLPGTAFKAFYGRALPRHRDMRPQMADTLKSIRAQVVSLNGLTPVSSIPPGRREPIVGRHSQYD